MGFCLKRLTENTFFCWRRTCIHASNCFGTGECLLYIYLFLREEEELPVLFSPISTHLKGRSRGCSSFLLLFTPKCRNHYILNTRSQLYSCNYLRRCREFANTEVDSSWRWNKNSFCLRTRESVCTSKTEAQSGWQTQESDVSWVCVLLGCRARRGWLWIPFSLVESGWILDSCLVFVLHPAGFVRKPHRGREVKLSPRCQQGDEEHFLSV